MKVYIGYGDAPSNYKHVMNGIDLSKLADAEATEITCERFLSSWRYSDSLEILKTILNKTRKGGVVTFYDIDCSLLSKVIFREEADLDTINTTIFRSGNVGHFTNMNKLLADLESLPKMSEFEIVSKHYDSNTSSFVLKIKRSK